MRPFGIGSRIVIVWTLLCLGVLTGCRSSGIDPTGQHIFADPSLQNSSMSRPLYWEYPGAELRWDSTKIVVNPSRCVAPVGSDVVLLAGVVGPEGNYLRMNQRVEWLLSPDSAGEFLDYDRGTLVDLVFCDFNWPRKKSNHWVITSTSRRRLQLNYETPTPADDICVARGQCWVTVSSPVEGLSHVTAYAPTVYGWPAQKQTATIHWVDAEWQYPPPAVVAAGGRHLFTTTVTRHTDHSPRAGWRVRYEITGGPPAGFAPSGAQSVEALTNQSGQASVEIMQTQPGAGTNQVKIQILRPGSLDGSGGKSLEVNSNTTTITWSAPRLAVKKTGPSVGAVGATLSYRINVINEGDLPADQVNVTDEIPAGLELVSTNPPTESSMGQLRWNIARLHARQSRVFDVHLRAQRAGTVTSCAEAIGTGNLHARDCVTTVIGVPNLAISIVGPTTGTVGGEVQHAIIIENQGEAAATGLFIKDFYDAGLEFPGKTSPIEKELPDIAPGGHYQVGVGFRLTQPGNFGHRVEVIGNGGLRATGQTTINVSPAAVAPPITQQGATPLNSQPGLSVDKKGPFTATVGQTADFVLVVQNTGGVPLTNVKVVDSYDPQFHLVEATDKNERQGNSLIWTIRSLPIGMKRQFQVRCKCESAAAETYNGVNVTSAEGARGDSDARVEIIAASGTSLPTGPTQPQGPGLKMAVVDFADSYDIGRPIRYEVVVENISYNVHENLLLDVDFPYGIKPIDGSLKGYPGVVGSVVGQTIQFQQVGALRPGDKLRYIINAQATAAGQMKVLARLASKNLSKPLTAEEDTKILNSP